LTGHVGCTNIGADHHRHYKPTINDHITQYTCIHATTRYDFSSAFLIDDGIQTLSSDAFACVKHCRQQAIALFGQAFAGFLTLTKFEHFRWALSFGAAA